MSQQPYGPPPDGPRYSQPAQQPRTAPPRARSAGYFRSLFDLSYANLGAPKFARVFQLLFMIASFGALAVGMLLILDEGIEGSEQTLYFVLTGVGGLIAWLLLNTLVRLILEAVVGIVQTAENTEEMLELMRNRA